MSDRPAKPVGLDRVVTWGDILGAALVWLAWELVKRAFL